MSISIALAALAFAFLVYMAFAIPYIFSRYIAIMGKGEFFTEPLKERVLILLYAILIPAFAADVGLMFLLRNARAKNIFSASSVSDLSLISHCCFAETILFVLLSFHFLLSLIVAFAAFSPELFCVLSKTS